MFYRHITKVLKERYHSARSVYLFGPRQSGKTTLVKYAFPELPYVNLEDPDVLEFSIQDPRGFFNQFEKTKGGIIDEPQRHPELFHYLQGQIDLEKRRFILTSSQNFLMIKSVTQSLAGRISILNLMPLCAKEIFKKDALSFEELWKMNELKVDLEQINKIWDLVLKGGYPEIYENPNVFPYWFSDYVKTYLERDVRRIINIQDLNQFQRFIKLCSGRTGMILNKASLASDCGISESTCSKWLGLLEQSGIILLLKPYHTNFTKRIVKSPKLHFIDSGLCCHLLGIRTVEHLKTHPLLGSILESYVVSELYKNSYNNGENQEFYYWCDQNKNEIDLIVELPDGKVFPIEIKAGQTVVNSAIRTLENWCELAGVSKGILLYGGDKYQSRTHLDVIPLVSLYS